MVTAQTFFGFVTPYSPTITLYTCVLLYLKRRITGAKLDLKVGNAVATLEKQLPSIPATVPGYALACMKAEDDQVLTISDKLLDKAWSLQREFELVSESVHSISFAGGFDVDLKPGGPYTVVVDALSGEEVSSTVDVIFNVYLDANTAVADMLSFSATVYPGASMRMALPELRRRVLLRFQITGYTGDFSVKVYRFTGKGIEKEVSGILTLYFEDGTRKSYELVLGRKYYRVGMPLGPSGDLFMLGVY